MAGGLFGLGAVTGPLLGPDRRRLAHRRLELALDLPRQRARRRRRRRPRVPLHRGARLRAPRRAHRHLRHRACSRSAWRSLQYVLEEGQPRRLGLDGRSCVLAAVAAIALVTFVVHELETPSIRSSTCACSRTAATRAGTGINFLLGIALFSGSYLFSLYCGAVMHYTALDIGKVFLVAGLVQIVLMPLIGRFSGARRRPGAGRVRHRRRVPRACG